MDSVAEENARLNASPTMARDPAGLPLPHFVPATPNVGSHLAKGTPAPGAESADPQARPDIVQQMLRDQQQMLNDLQAASMNRENDDNRRTLLAAINALAKQANSTD